LHLQAFDNSTAVALDCLQVRVRQEGQGVETYVNNTLAAH